MAKCTLRAPPFREADLTFEHYGKTNEFVAVATGGENSQVAGKAGTGFQPELRGEGRAPITNPVGEIADFCAAVGEFYLTRAARRLLFTNMGERKNSEPKLDDVFLALSHPTRRRMLELLQDEPRCVTALAESFDLSLNVVSKHLKYLERAGLLERTRAGRIHMLQCNNVAMQPATTWLAHHLRMWTGALNSLEQFIIKSKSNPKSP